MAIAPSTKAILATIERSRAMSKGKLIAAVAVVALLALVVKRRGRDVEIR